MDYVTVKWLHIMSSTFLFGTGVGSAFYLLVTSLTRDVRAVAVVSRQVVLADWLFTTTTAVIQPLTGYWLIRLAGFPLTSRWLSWSIMLYVLAIACWLPVVWLQMRLRDVACDADRAQAPLPALYWRYFWIWVVLGIPAFFAFVTVFYLMVAKPT
ncbi:MAG TPA: DUF2269 domain-containing protein [Noviherbaspirillum sp.]|uniref:DUF2269 family protein n=1 Tax=Noviherbaspirillum sp. TaxID=1926288 RepID=UPI002D5FDDCA|nr:DUF2269 domain-containing protein [Noviherbaspirillum sp.]HYD93839.1 DUF2269 domain-containing protein [Noviherbaspirillum sp.]